MSFVGKINQYTCSGCGETMTTVDRDDGTTPMAIGCQIHLTCGGRMISHMYLVDQTLEPTHEWYRPTGKVQKAYREHVAMGGLLIRKIDGK